MAHYVLASTHVSSIYPISKLNVIPIDTVRRDVPLPEPDSSILNEHASFASVFSHRATTVFIRVIHGGLILELATPTSSRPARFSFPSPIIPIPGVLIHQFSELRVLVATTSGSLFTLIFPISAEDGTPSFDVAYGSQNWCREHLITAPVEELEGPAHVKDIDCIVIGLSRGRFLRFDCGEDFSMFKLSFLLVYVNNMDFGRLVAGKYSSSPNRVDFLSL